MRMRNGRSILLVNPAFHARQTLAEEQFARFQPLGLAYIAAATPESWKVEIVDEAIDDVGSLEGYDVVGVTVSTRSALRSFQLAERAKAAGCHTVAGGIHATMRREETLGYFDTIVEGEGEMPWRSFLEDFERGAPKRFYSPSPFQDLDALPAPKRSAMNGRYSVASIQTSRGCPFDCSFCSVTAFNGGRYRHRSPALVLDELESIPQKYLFFVDDNLAGVSERSIARAKDIFRGMVERGLGKEYFGQVTVNFGLDDELLELASRSGCRGVFFGIESLDEEALKHMNKRLNLKTGISRYRELIKRIQDHGIAVIGLLIFGADGESPEVFDRAARFVDESGLDAVQLTVMTPLPGTKLFEQLTREDRIVFNRYPDDWIQYSLGTLVYRLKGASPAEFAAGWKRMIDFIYSKHKVMRRTVGTLFRTMHLSSAYVSWRLNNAYRHAYLNSSFYRNPPLEALASHPLMRAAGLGTVEREPLLRR
jgi:radical SAM superfamily enzyme YgiQ (UPF0313 family)